MSFFHNGHSHPHSHPRRRFLSRSFFFLGRLATASTAAQPDHVGEHEHPRESAPENVIDNQQHPSPSKTAAPGESTGQHRNGEPFPVFDAHLHCPSDESSGEIWQWYPVTRTFADFANYLEKTGVQRGIINAQRCNKAERPADFIAGNREVARYVEKYKGRFLGACVVNPVFIDEALREIEYCKKELGFNWVGELCNYVGPLNYEYTIREFELLVNQVSKLKMVLDVHTGLDDMHYVIQKFPEATIVFPHFDDDQSVFHRIALIATHPNSYIDTSGYGIDRVGILEYAVKTIGEDRILFGSDFSINCPTAALGRIQNAFLTDQQKRKILSGNLENLLRKVNS
jgi:hypothetical protein